MQLRILLSLSVFVLPTAVLAQSDPTIIVAEGEAFQPLGEDGWQITHQNDSYASHTYGGMWVTHGGLLGASAESEGALASKTVTIPTAGQYRVWSKYQAPPYFKYLHEIEIVQNGQSVYRHTYGKSGTDRLWSFSGDSDELWWPWGIDHDAAEAPTQMVQLAAGPAEIRLKTLKSPELAGERFIDFVLLTTHAATEYQGFKPYAVGSPFTLEALAQTPLWLRFQNTTAEPTQLKVSRAGHYQPQYGSASTMGPESPVAPGAWSEWIHIGPFCRLVHDEGLTMSLPGGRQFPVQFARDANGNDIVGDMRIDDGEKVHVPLEITWQEGARVRPSREHARDIIEASKSWRQSSTGAKPEEILFFGAFRGDEPWIPEFKHALGFNTQLPDGFAHVQRDGVHTHAHNEAQIRQLAERLSPEEKQRMRVVSFGDEIGLGKIDFNNPQSVEAFRGWLRARNLTQADLGVPIDQATLTATGDPRLIWYSQLFSDEQRFAQYRELTRLTRELIGDHVLTGANYSPHKLALYYGSIPQWVNIFKNQGMSMFWGEDYIFSVPEVPQIISWQFAQMRCATKYHHQPIHFYCMPHAPGQEPEYLRRNVLLAVGSGARHIDHFWVAPAENFTENYVAWNYHDTFRTIAECIADTADAEELLAGAQVRPGRVAIITGLATDFNEERLMVPKANDPFASRCRNAPELLNQTLCRKEQQMLYLALRHAQHAVDLITEDDIVELDVLKQYEVVYLAGEWLDHRAVPKLEAWVNEGGVLYACAGLGLKDEFGADQPAMRNLLGLQSAELEKNAVVVRTLQELPLLANIDTITLDEAKIPSFGMRQRLTPNGAHVLGQWSDGSAAVTMRELGQGQVFAVGTLPGTGYMKSGLRVVPFARGGRTNLYNPEDFDPAATHLVRLGVDAANPDPIVTCSSDLVEAIVADHPTGTVVTLVNWSNAPIQGLQVRVNVKALPRQVRSVRWRRDLPMEADGNAVTFTVDVEDADYILMR